MAYEECKLPPAWWHRNCNNFYAKRYSDNVRSELSQRGDLKLLLAEKIESFIVWAGKTRLNYEKDLDEEVSDFLSSNFRDRQRMYNTNVKKWKSISCQVFKRDNYTCQYCGLMNGNLEVDHIVPFSKGGSDELFNLTTACKRCNIQKKDKSVVEFKKWKYEREQLLFSR